eukprot:CAMPEP_0179108608 /NCGR_PEP_ID=MMETSP0796-20121207/50598_1 /TAXON_ID=73915 /ORGANISM="Pyrodinium bahamense, Strain pbaha01" /LENGTH=288 /DNA_ID=CAMNT_0020806685 /DNA_START=36 /DNA_END=902 /DNA_ORIENTATION=+
MGDPSQAFGPGGSGHSALQMSMPMSMPVRPSLGLSCALDMGAKGTRAAEEQDEGKDVGRPATWGAAAPAGGISTAEAREPLPPCLRAPSPSRPWRLLCIGDSLTCDPHGGYPKHLQQLLNADSCGEWTVKDFGVRGSAVVAADGLAAYRRLPRLAPELKVRPPDVVVVMLGTNDARRGTWAEDAFVGEYIALLQQLQGTERCRPVLVLVPPRATANRWRVDVGIVDTELPKAVRCAATSLGLLILDTRGVLRETHLDDGAHLTNMGAQVLAEFVHGVLRELATMTDQP